MANLTCVSLVQKIRYMINDLVDYNVDSNDLVDGNRFNNSTVIDAINFAVRFYCKNTNASYTTTTAAISSAGIVSAPSDYLEIIRVLADGRLLTKTNYEWESIRDEDWEVLTGDVRSWLFEDSRNLKLTPIETAWATPTVNATIGYLQAPKNLTTISAVTAGSFVSGNWYQIVSTGDTDFTLIGAADSTVGTQFLSTGVGSGTGTAYEVVDARVIEQDQEYLKYAATSFLHSIEESADSVARADAMISIFKQLIGG